jgi:RNA-directed DNA polymerase
VRGKRKKKDVQEFQYRLMDNILELHRELARGTYRHGGYHAFKISDPKPRDIHKASVRDRLLHHALYRKLYPFFDPAFITDSYSCRVGKGTDRALNKFRAYAFRVSRNDTCTCWILKCDILKFFASIDQELLVKILTQSIPDKRILHLLDSIVSSFSARPGKGLPLGNLTSQLLVNVYMNEFDRCVKHRLKVPYYIRYADDFVLLSHSKVYLEGLLKTIRCFLSNELKLALHPNKVFIKTFASGVDFLGWVHFSDHRILRTSTKRRAVRNCRGLQKDSPVVMAYLGLMKHGNAHRVVQKLML